jgi:hypothetical protein
VIGIKSPENWDKMTDKQKVKWIEDNLEAKRCKDGVCDVL